MLGGSSSLNAMMWVRGHYDDYDDWDVPGWSYEDVVPYFKRAEGRVGSNKGDVYGTSGPVTISEQRSPNETTRAFLEACAAAGLTRLPELNGPSHEGYALTPVSQRRGRRCSAADAYLRPARGRSNLTVVTGAQVSRVLIEDGRATGVEYAALHAPDLELIFAPAPYIAHGLTPPTEHGVTLGVVLLRPESSGRITLASADPAAPPVIDPAYLTEEGDLRRLMHGIRRAEELMAADALKPYVGDVMEPYVGADDEEALAAYVRGHSETLYHPTGTCRMGTGAGSVVDPDLRVRGVEGLRVADASVLPQITRGHTNAPAIMIGEKAADLIRTPAS